MQAKTIPSEEMSASQRAVHVITSLSQQPSNDLSLLVANTRTLDESLLYWKFYSKAKDVLPQSQRVENLTWRLLHLNLKKEQAKKDEVRRVTAVSASLVDVEYPIYLQDDTPTVQSPSTAHNPIATQSLTSSPLTSTDILLLSQSLNSTHTPIAIPTDHQHFEHTLATSLPTTSSQVICTNCTTTITPLWRRDAQGQPLCNACGLFFKLHLINRPVHLNRGTIKKRVRQKKPLTPQYLYTSRVGQEKIVPLKIERGSPTSSVTNSSGSAGSLYADSKPASMPKHSPVVRKPALVPMFQPHPLFHPLAMFQKQPIATPLQSSEQLYNSLINDQMTFTQHPQQLKRMKPDSDSLITDYSSPIAFPSNSLPFQPYFNSLPHQPLSTASRPMPVLVQQDCSLSEMFTKNEEYVKCQPVHPQSSLSSLAHAHSWHQKTQPFVNKNIGMDLLINPSVPTYMDILIDPTSRFNSSIKCSQTSSSSPLIATVSPASLPNHVHSYKTHFPTSAEPSLFECEAVQEEEHYVDKQEYIRDPCLSDTMLLSKVMSNDEPFGGVSEAWLDSYLGQ